MTSSTEAVNALFTNFGDLIDSSWELFYVMLGFVLFSIAFALMRGPLVRAMRRLRH